MNILVVAHYQGDGSPSAIFIHDQIRAYLALGHQVRVLTPIAVGKTGWDGKRWGKLVRWEDVDGATYCFLRYVSLSRYGNGWFNAASASFVLKRCISRLLRDFRPDVIHAHTLGFDSELGALLKERLHVPLVVTTHGSDTFIPHKNGQVAQLKPTCDRADRIVAVSSLLAKTVAFSGTSTPISVILNGFQVSNACTSHQASSHWMIQVGSLIERKKVHDTISAFAQIKAWYSDATLTIVGEGPERSSLEAQCRRLGVAESVHFLGQLSNRAVLEEMARHTVFVMPSVREGFGIVYLEAMASGCLTIGTQGEGIADFIQDGKNGFLIPPESPDAIAEKVQWCFSHPEETDRIAQQGRQAALAQTWAKNAREMTALMENLLER